VRTLGTLSSLDPKDVGLENFGSHKLYFPCQIKSLSTATLAQAAVIYSWLSAVRTLGAHSSLDPKDVGLENFGPHKPYFPRQIKSLSKVTLAQAAVKDVDSGEPVGEIPGWRELIAWYEQSLPDERTTGVRILHRDYKLDNLIFHPTENRVIDAIESSSY